MHRGSHIIGCGSIGGKGEGFLKVKNFIEKISSEESSLLKDFVSFPKTVFICTDFFNNYVSHNKLDGLIDEVETANFNKELCCKIEDLFLNGVFSKGAEKELLDVLQEFDGPIVVRSSSLLEDQEGASFAGKYESVFVANFGDLNRRKEAFLNAIKKVYSTTFNPNALEYRCKHGFIKEKEAMAILVQGVVGRQYKKYYLPAMSGVAFSQNGYCWNREIKKEDGLVRLVFGLGTTAVGRGYVRLFSPTKPSIRPEGTEVNNIQKCSQKKVDVVDTDEGLLKTVHFRELISDGFDCYPNSQAMISLRDGAYLYKPVSNIWDKTHVPVLTMDGVLNSPWLKLDIAKILHSLLKELERNFGFSVDLEFAIDFSSENKNGLVYVLQTRPLSESANHQPEEIPLIESKDLIISTVGSMPTSSVSDIEYIVYVDDKVYHDWPHNEKQTIARTIGKLNDLLKGKKFALIGPGRWGSWNPDLGVPVGYSEISNCSLLVEVARRKATYVPEVSFGSHFFQDLIEDDISYLAVYPDNEGVLFNEKIFHGISDFNNLLTQEFYKQYDRLIKVVHIPSVKNGKTAKAILNGELEKAVLFLS